MTETEKSEIFNLTETPTEPTPAAQTPIRTDFSKLQEIFEQYSTAKEARQHIAEVATGHNKFNQTFGESSIRKVIAKKCKFKGDAGKIESREATAKIGAGTEMDIQPEQTATAEPEAAETAMQQPINSSPEFNPALSMIGSYEEVKAELSPIQERAVKGLVDNVFSIAGLKGNGKGEGDPLLTDQDSKDTVTLIPYILKKVTKQEMNQENYENLTIGMHTAHILSKVVKRRIEKGKLSKQENPAAAEQIPQVAVIQPEATKTQATASAINTLNPPPSPPISQQVAAFKERAI